MTGSRISSAASRRGGTPASRRSRRRRRRKGCPAWEAGPMSYDPGGVRRVRGSRLGGEGRRRLRHAARARHREARRAAAGCGRRRTRNAAPRPGDRPRVRRRACCRTRSGGCGPRPLRSHARVRARARARRRVRRAATSWPSLSRTSPSTPSPLRFCSSISPSPSGPAAEAARVLESDGVVAFTVWDVPCEDAGSACSSTRSRTWASRHRRTFPQDRRSSGSRTRRSSPS